jgi:hypothetical protein
VTYPKVEQAAPERNRPVVLILAREFRRRLGNVSNSTLWRLEKSDPRFPKPIFIRGLRARTEDQADDYARALLEGETREGA